MKVFVGYDAREDIAYKVCEYSIKKHQPNAEVIPLVQDDLRKLGLYWREKDALASTDFSLTRFLVPALMNYQGWAVFVDCDFLWTDDIQKLFDLRDESKAVMVVKHDYTPSGDIKMDGQQQHVYPRKNWSSMILWNCAHPSNKYLVPEAVNAETPQFLHRFQWIKDHYIGEVGKEWNWLVGVYSELYDGKPKAIHYTNGGPWFENYKDREYGPSWIQEKWEYEGKKFPLPVVLAKAMPPAGYLEKHSNNFIDAVNDVSRDLVAAHWYGKNNLIATPLNKEHAKFNKRLKRILDIKYNDYTAIVTAAYNNRPIIEKDIRYKGDLPLLVRGIASGDLIRQQLSKGKDCYFIETGYLGNYISDLNPGARKLYHRIVKNAMQEEQIFDVPDDRWKKLIEQDQKLNWKGWKKQGSKILLVAPSEKPCEFYGINKEEWIANTINELKTYTDREIVIREKVRRGSRSRANTIYDALDEDIFALVTYNSIAAVESIAYGIPAFALAPTAAKKLALSDLSKIETPYYPDEGLVYKWCSSIAYGQFRLDEIVSGYAWQIVIENDSRKTINC